MWAILHCAGTARWPSRFARGWGPRRRPRPSALRTRIGHIEVQFCVGQRQSSARRHRRKVPNSRHRIDVRGRQSTTQPACQVAPKRPDGEPSLFLFHFYEAAARDLTHWAATGPSRRALKFCQETPTSDSFQATLLKPSLARLGHLRVLARARFPAAHHTKGRGHRESLLYDLSPMFMNGRRGDEHLVWLSKGVRIVKPAACVPAGNVGSRWPPPRHPPSSRRKAILHCRHGQTRPQGSAAARAWPKGPSACERALR